MIKTGIVSNAYFNLYDYESGLKTAKKHGYDCIDYQEMISPGSPLYKMSGAELSAFCKDLRKAAESAGIKIWQIHSVWPHDDTTKESRKEVLKRHETVVKAAGMLGSKYAVLHPAMPYGWGEEKSIKDAFDITAERFIRLLPIAKDLNVTLCVENMPFKKGHSVSSIEEIKNLVKTINQPNMKACFDTGHCNVTCENHYEAIRLLGNDLACLHVHDDIYKQDRHLIPFQGEVDWEGFKQGLQEIEFKGCLSLETCVSRKTPEPMKSQMQLALSNIARHLANF